MTPRFLVLPCVGSKTYIKKLLPKGVPAIIEEADVPVWKNFILQIGGTDDLQNYKELKTEKYLIVFK